MKRHAHCWRAACCLLALLTVAAVACGKKGDPIRPESPLPKAIADFRAEAGTEGVRILWTVPAAPSEIHRVKILRSEIETAGPDCAGCPRNFIEIANLLASEPRIETEGASMRYQDRDVRAGCLYTYRIVFCDRSGYCIPMAGTAETKIEKVGS